MALYQTDVLEEEVLGHWGTHASKKYVDKDVSKKVRASAGPFLKVSFPIDCVWSGCFANTIILE